MDKKVYNVKNVERIVRSAISKYCKDKGISQAEFLKKDERIQKTLKELSTK